MTHELSRQEINDVEEALQNRFQEVKEDIEEEFRQSGEEDYVTLAGTVRDLGDESMADVLTDTNATLLHRHIHEVRAIEAAMKRLHDNTINICQQCGGAISVPRLIAYPTATRCITCQEHYERTHAQQ